MCEFCIKHGEGKKWYLNMDNYSRELWNQPGREEFTDDFLIRFEEQTKSIRLADHARNIPGLNRFVMSMVTRMVKAYHWGQILPIEDIELVLDLQDSIVLLPCPCRKVTTGREARYCIGLGLDIAQATSHYPDYHDGMEVLGREQAKRLLNTFDREGLTHSVWTFKTPYIGAICNCDQDCLPYRLQVKTGVMQMMFRAEYVGSVDWDLCTGCRKCIRNCQFGAIRYSAANQKAYIDMQQCYGCGVCRVVCDKGAITLRPREEYAGLPW